MCLDYLWHIPILEYQYSQFLEGITIKRHIDKGMDESVLQVDVCSHCVTNSKEEQTSNMEQILQRRISIPSPQGYSMHSRRMCRIFILYSGSPLEPGHEHWIRTLVKIHKLQKI